LAARSCNVRTTTWRPVKARRAVVTPTIVGWAFTTRLMSLACLLFLLAPTAALAQQARPSVLAIDTTAAVDPAVDDTGNVETGVVLDAVVSVDLGRGFEGIVRPIVQRSASGGWEGKFWVATLRYERPGPVGLRIDGGLISSPVGLANLTLRPHLNPNISQPASLFTELPPLDLGGAGTILLGAIYPLGAQVTVSGPHWDARAAIIDKSPIRTDLPVHAPRFTNVVIGGGVTPVVGLRVGTSVTRGGWQRAGERPFITADRDATIVTVESEFSFRYTKLSGEWVRDAGETSAGDRVASGWFVQGQQTLAPHWFVAGRVERMSSPAALATGAVPLTFAGVEETLGFRVTPDITLRAGHRARRPFAIGRPGYTHQATVSIVWWKRWM